MSIAVAVSALSADSAYLCVLRNLCGECSLDQCYQRSMAAARGGEQPSTSASILLAVSALSADDVPSAVSAISAASYPPLYIGSTFDRNRKRRRMFHCFTVRTPWRAGRYPRCPNATKKAGHENTFLSAKFFAILLGYCIRLLRVRFRFGLRMTILIMTVRQCGLTHRCGGVAGRAGLAGAREEWTKPKGSPYVRT